GTAEVWGAILASTLTTVAVFLPILFVAQEAGQLFRDLALAISAAVALSLGVSVTVVPALAARLLGRAPPRPPRPARLARAAGRAAAALVRRPLLRLATIAGLTAAAVALAYGLAPPPEYLPTGNRNLVIAFLLPPPGMSLPAVERVAAGIERDLAPLWQGEGGRPPRVAHLFSVSSPSRIFLGLSARDPARVRELIPPVRARLRREPGMIAVVTQASLFGRVVGGGRSIDLALTGERLEPILAVAREAYGRLRRALPEAQVRPRPGLTLGEPELHLVPRRERLAEVGMSAADLAVAADALVDGVRAATVRLGGREVDIRLMAEPDAVRHTQEVAALPVRTPGGQVVPLGSLARVAFAPGPTEIHHLEGERVVTLEVRPPRTEPLAAAMATIEGQVLAPLRAAGRLGGAVRARLAGTADRLSTTFEVVKGNFALAVAITYLLMAALFGSFLYPVAILFSIPLAVAGGFLGLWLVSHLLAYQPLD
ncbi:MAG: efflux RND transporter permease subunit, partial [Nitrospirae bacterium]